MRETMVDDERKDVNSVKTSDGSNGSQDRKRLFLMNIDDTRVLAIQIFSASISQRLSASPNPDPYFHLMALKFAKETL